MRRVQIEELPTDVAEVNAATASYLEGHGVEVLEATRKRAYAWGHYQMYFVPPWVMVLWDLSIVDLGVSERALSEFARGDEQFRAAGLTALTLGGSAGLEEYLDAQP